MFVLGLFVIIGGMGVLVLIVFWFVIGVILCCCLIEEIGFCE